MDWREEGPRKSRTKGGAPARYREEAEELRENPGRWAVLKTYFNEGNPAYRMAWYVRNGKLAAFAPEGSFEATVQRTGNLYEVYVRYIGTNNEVRLHYYPQQSGCPLHLQRGNHC